MATKRENIYRVLAVLVSLFVGLLIAEVGLRMMNRLIRVSGWRGESLVSKNENNQLRYRGQNIEYTDSDFVIILLGDSQVQANACAYEWMPERRLQYYLNSRGKRVKVFSIGASGYGQDQQLLALREYYQKFRADLIILWETPANDVANNLFPTHFHAEGIADGMYKPTFWLEDGNLRGPSEEIGQRLRETPRIKLIALWRKAFGWSRDSEWEKTYPPAYKPMTEFEGPVKEDWQQWWNNDEKGFRGENLSNEKAHVPICLTPRSERMRYGLDLTRKLLQEIERLASSHNGKLVTFTTTPDVGSSLGCHANAVVRVLNGKYYRTSERQYNDNLNYINEEVDFYLIPITIEQHRVGPEDGHLNEHAVDQVMKDLAARIETLIPAH